MSDRWAGKEKERRCERRTVEKSLEPDGYEVGSVKGDRAFRHGGVEGWLRARTWTK